jgi:hypothetical protein
VSAESAPAAVTFGETYHDLPRNGGETLTSADIVFATSQGEIGRNLVTAQRAGAVAFALQQTPPVWLAVISRGIPHVRYGVGQHCKRSPLTAWFAIAAAATMDSDACPTRSRAGSQVGTGPRIHLSVRVHQRTRALRTTLT